ncbi:MAG TPA: TonB-dependent receptor [Caulobacteraceae bacterium]|nr:TonB-dependent receptor [Caulobacteraceae bacterium]
MTAHAWATPQAVTPDTLTLVSGPGQSAVDKLRQLSIDELANLQVISVEKRPESLSKAPAAIYVITHDDIIRSGAVTVPEMLRLAPNLQVYQQSAGSWVVTARGFSGNPAAQAFSNLMLVLIDGRSVYNPVFTGVYWDMLDVQADDVDRIEVISGPAGTLWGANAVQGVINIVTRKASETQGGLADVVWGTQTRAVTAQFGGKVRDDLAFRLWARDLTLYDTRTVTGTRAYDSIHRPSGGFRADWDPGSADSVSLRGDYAEGSGEIQGYPSVLTSSRDINGRWNHVWGAGIFSLLAYFDRETQTSGPGGSPFLIDTYDIEAQQTATIASWNHLVFGAGFRRYAYSIGDTVLVWTPRAGDLDVIDGFVQDDITLRRNVRLTLGLKLEDDPHSGLSPMPNVRLSWDIRPDAMAWASASRAIRAPAPFDTDIAEVSGGQTLLRGNPHFQSEVVTAYELGGRLTPSTRLSVSASGYFNVYDDLRNIQLAPGGFFPLQWGNGIAGHTAGFDVWADWRVTDWWRLTPSFDLLRENLHFKPGASPILGLRQDGLDPQQQAQLRSSMELGHGLTLDTALRYVDALPGGVGVPAYVELDSRLGWRISRKLEISVAGSNLLHDRHQELPGASEIPRAVRVELRAGF